MGLGHPWDLVQTKVFYTPFVFSDNCDLEYIDIYSELKTPSDDLLTSMTPSRYCGTVSPHVRISLHNIIVVVFHSRVGKKRSDLLKIFGKYNFISNGSFQDLNKMGPG